MKKSFLTAVLIAIAALCISCSKGSSDSGSGSGSGSSSGSKALLNFNPELFTDSDVPQEVTTGSFDLSAGTWAESCIENSVIAGNLTVYYYEYTVTDSAATCTKYQRYYIWQLSSSEVQVLNQMTAEEIKSQYDLDDYALSSNKFVGVKSYTDETSLNTKSDNTNNVNCLSANSVKSNAEGTKFLVETTLGKYYWCKK